VTDLHRLVREGYDASAHLYLGERPTDGADAALLDELAAYLSPGAAVLDAGCGAGVPVTRRLVGAGFDVVGLDASNVQLALLRDHVPNALPLRADLTSLPFADGCFEAVTSYYAIIHVPREEHATVFAEIRRVLRAQGYALLCVGFNDNPHDRDTESWLATDMYWSHFDAPTNLALLHEAGFDIVFDRFVADPMGHSGHLFVLARRR
jgi:SAM-dependent methyltransferase